MTTNIDRRRFLITAGAGLASLGLAAPGRLAGGAPHADRLGWRRNCLFNCFDPPVLEQAIDKTASLGLHYFEAGSRPTVFTNTPKVHLDPSLPPDIVRSVAYFDQVCAELLAAKTSCERTAHDRMTLG
jgi:hypothetical protein